MASLNIGLLDGNDAKVAAVMNPALSRAIADERAEMDRYFTAVAQDIAKQAEEGRLTIDV